MPKPLPNPTATKRASSDASEEELKGKVKKVVEYERRLLGATKSAGWHFSAIDEYDENGDRSRQVYFNDEEKPYILRVYGYIDGQWVSRSNSFDDDIDRMTTVGPQQTPLHPPDERYDLSYEYTYKGGRLKEWKLINNDGTRWMKYEYERTADERSSTAFDEWGKINQKSLFKLDKNGNDIERTDVDVRKVYGHDSRYLITYQSFDKSGNWTQRTFTKIESKDGKEVRELAYEEFRVITYYGT